jgi:cysteine synthase A
MDRIVSVDDDDAFATALRLTREEGLLVGVSAGANVFAAIQVAEELGAGKRVVTLLPDTGERYLSMEW